MMNSWDREGQRRGTVDFNWTNRETGNATDRKSHHEMYAEFPNILIKQFYTIGAYKFF